MLNFIPAVLIALFSILPLPAAYAHKREINCFVEHDDFDTNKDIKVVHIIAESRTDIVHYVWSTFDLPSVIIARTSNTTTLNINMTKLESFENDAITFSEQPLESIGLTISEVWKLTYNYSKEEIFDINPLNLKSFKWENMSYNCSKTFASTTFTATNDDDVFSKNGTLQIRFSAAAEELLSSEYPHLIFNGNSTEIEVTLDNFLSNFTKTRYGLEVMLFSTSSKHNVKQWSKEISYSVNDENSPGVFSDVELISSFSFVTWRPVAYTGKVPTVANSSDVQMLSECEPIGTTIPRSIAEVYFENKSNFSAFNISFGKMGENFYPKTKFNKWSLMVGIGSAVKVKISPLVIVFIAVGLGLFLVFFIGAVIFMTYRQCFKKDDDLLLSKRSIN